MIQVKCKGDWSKTNKFLEKALNLVKLGKLDQYGREGVTKLAESTPKDTGETAGSWYYKIVRNDTSVSLQWLNSAQNDGIPIVILIQYGHAFQNGIYVQGVDFINPTMRHVFDGMVDNLWKELTAR